MKKILLGLGITFLSFIGFSNAGSFIYTGHFNGILENSRNVFSFPTPLNGIPYNGNAYVNCSFSNYNSNLSSITLNASTYGITNANSTVVGIILQNTIIPDTNSVSFEIYGSSIKNRVLGGVSFKSVGSTSENVSFDWLCTVSGSAVLDIPICQECPEIDTGAILSGYVSEGLLNECLSEKNSCQSALSGWNNTLNNCSNNLLSCESSLSSCIQSNCPIDTGDVMWSAIWINGIQHLGKPVINIDIPDQIFWQYTTDDEEFNLYVGSGYDQEYIDSVLSINSYRPTSEDFTYMFVSGLTLIFPYIFVALLIIFIWKLIKRIFK